MIRTHGHDPCSWCVLSQKRYQMIYFIAYGFGIERTWCIGRALDCHVGHAGVSGSYPADPACVLQRNILVPPLLNWPGDDVIAASSSWNEYMDVSCPLLTIHVPFLYKTQTHQRQREREHVRDEWRDDRRENRLPVPTPTPRPTRNVRRFPLLKTRLRSPKNVTVLKYFAFTLRARLRLFAGYFGKDKIVGLIVGLMIQTRICVGMFCA